MRFLAIALWTTAALGTTGCCDIPCDPCCPPCHAIEAKPSLFVNPPLRPPVPGAAVAEPATVVPPPPGTPLPPVPVPDLPGDAPPLVQPERLESK